MLVERGALRVVPCSFAEEGSGNGFPQSGDPSGLRAQRRHLWCKSKLWPLLLDSDNFEVKIMWKTDVFGLGFNFDYYCFTNLESEKAMSRKLMQ